MSYPVSWDEVYERLAIVLGGYPPPEWARATTHDLVAQALGGTYGIGTVMTAEQRRDSYARTASAVIALETECGDLTFALGVRGTLAETFARHFDGLMVEGPPWRLGPDEPDRPLYDDWVASAGDFGVTPA